VNLGGFRFLFAYRRSLAVGLGLVLTLELLRAWAVSLPFFFQGYVRMPAVVMALIAFSPFILAFGGKTVLRRKPVPMYTALGLLVVVRLGLQFTNGGLYRLILALLGLVVCLQLLTCFASRQDGPAGIVFGLALDAWLLMALKTESMIFRNGWSAFGGIVALLLVFVLAACLTISSESRSPASAGSLYQSGLAGWAALGPVLVLHLVLGTLPARLEVASGWGPVSSRIVISMSYTAALALALHAIASPARTRRLLLAALLGSGAVILLAFLGPISGNPYARVLSITLLPIGILVGTASVFRTSPSGRQWWSELGLAGSVAAAVGLTVVYYLGFVYRYPLRPEWVLVLAGCVFLALLVRAAARTRGSRPLVLEAANSSTAGPGRRLIMVALILGALVTATGCLNLSDDAPTTPESANGFPVRVASYNIFMGLGADVRLDLDRLAEQIASQHADVIALQEVSRGWFVSGSVDVLPRLAERLGFSYHFFPAHGETWGNAIMTNLTSVAYAQGGLPQGDPAMKRGWGGVVLDLGRGQELLVVVSHLHHLQDGGGVRTKQAEVLVTRAMNMASGPQATLATIIAGDFNAEADAVELGALRDHYIDVMAAAGHPSATYPSWAPVQRIDYIFASSGLRGSEPAVFGGPASDHLGISVNLDAAPPDEDGNILASLQREVVQTDEGDTTLK